LKLHLIKIVLCVILITAFNSAAQELKNIAAPRQKYLYEYREIYLARVRDSLNSELYKIRVDKNSVNSLTEEIYSKTFGYNRYKYSLYNRVDSVKLLEFTHNDLSSSAFFKSKIPVWSDSALIEYLTFRIELNLIKNYFSEFNLSEFKNTDVYKTFLRRIEKDSLSVTDFDNVLEKIQKIGFDPLHFYYKPKSKEEQLKADEFKIEKFDFNEMIRFIQEHSASLDSAEARYKVNKEIIVAILRKETHLGQFELKYNPFEVLLGQALYSITNPATEITERANNLKRISRLQTSAANSLYYIIKFCIENSFDPQNLRSNAVGAMGHPQFMPFNLHLARDGNEDGVIDLTNIDDSIMSIGNFLSDRGWNKFYTLNKSNKSRIVKLILTYNPNDSYADSIFEIAFELKKRAGKEKK